MARRLTRRRFRQAHCAALPGVRLRPPTAAPAPTPVFENWVIPLLDADGHPVPVPDFLLPRSRSTAPDPPPPPTPPVSVITRGSPAAVFMA